jgi:hypothetical protein
MFLPLRPRAIRRAAVLSLFGFVLLTPLLVPPAAWGSAHDFPFTYDWKQPAYREREVELHNTYLESGQTFEEECEFEYGFTERFSLAPYAVFERTPGERLRYSGFQLEARYQLTGYRPNALLVGLYEEYAKPLHAGGALESRLIVSRYDNAGGDWSFNYVLTNGFSRSPDFRRRYSLGYVRPLGASGRPGPRGGFEFLHDLSERRLNAGPVFGFSPLESTWLVTGYAAPLNRRHENRGEARIIAEYEF